MKLRMQITKEKEIRFISHLEYVRTIERAIRRAKLPAAYSEGFNPHLKFSLASALGVGVVSMAEFVEIELAEPMEVHEAVQKMTAALPRGIQIMAADVTANNAPALMASAGGADYLVVLPYSGEYVEAVAAFNAAESVVYDVCFLHGSLGVDRVFLRLVPAPFRRAGNAKVKLFYSFCAYFMLYYFFFFVLLCVLLFLFVFYMLPCVFLKYLLGQY